MTPRSLLTRGQRLAAGRGIIIAMSGQGDERSAELEAIAEHHGLTQSQLEAADEAGILPLLALDRILTKARPRYDEDQLVEAAGVDRDFLKRLWRAMGFPEVPPGVKAFSDADLEALRVGVDPNRIPGVDEPAIQDMIVQSTRVMSSSLARIAEGIADDISQGLSEARAEGRSDLDFVEMLRSPEYGFEVLDHLLVYMFRRQLRAALWRRLALEDHPERGVVMAIGFVDLVGYTAATAQLETTELAAMVGRFEALAYDTVAEHGGRVVKTIGDEILYSAPDAGTAVRIALTILAAVEEDDDLPGARAGVDCGHVLTRDGDVFGPVVNAASRIVDRARPGSALTTDAVHERLAEEPGLEWRPLGIRRLKGLGAAPLWRVRWANEEEDGGAGGAGAALPTTGDG